MNLMDGLGLTGMKVIESTFLTEPGEPEERRRSWRQRLFSRPWRPWKVTETWIPQRPYRGVVKMGRNTLVVHPDTLKQLRRQLDQA